MFVGFKILLAIFFNEFTKKGLSFISSKPAKNKHVIGPMDKVECKTSLTGWSDF
jgi:hypothetical protein